MTQNEVTRLSLALLATCESHSEELIIHSRQLDAILTTDLAPRHRALLEQWQASIKELAVLSQDGMRLFTQTAERPILESVG